ncbi:resolvase domain-containing protein [Methanococcus maripaludis X1]|jgi:DNA invertase Pin-like site-specific DNA recombinase|uniref:Resolvase domain-containing protein n=1 Tax=Methanococcus maripaludis X1 TaxID=1053692 RepID=G0H4V6_METMI|nr:recombinase family protein [Methanococcus maripaludis]AEK19737.1 resolvase domain-containing protein [Methanococcus maripaludis X1]
MIIGYARVSTKDQKLERQIDELRKAGCEKIFLEKISGTKKNRPEFDRMFGVLRSGDIILVTELTRISRSTKDLVEIVESCKSLGVEIKSLKESWLDTTSAHGKLLFTIFAGLAEFERDLISERVKSGLNAARSRGRLGGRPQIDSEKVEMALKMYDSKEYTIKQILNATGISKFTLYNYLDKRECKNRNKLDF